jgi:hypothetical protein
VSSTGTVVKGGVGCESVENLDIVVVIEWPSEGSEAFMAGIGDVLLHEVNIHVFDVFTKQLREVPCDLSLLHRNSRSGR